MSSVYDASAIRAALPPVNGDLFNVKTENGTDRKDLLPRQECLLNWGKEKISHTKFIGHFRKDLN